MGNLLVTTTTKDRCIAARAANRYLNIKMDYRKKVSWSSMALSLATLTPMTPDPQPWTVFNDNFTSVQGDEVK